MPSILSNDVLVLGGRLTCIDVGVEALTAAPFVVAVDLGALGGLGGLGGGGGPGSYSGLEGLHVIPEESKRWPLIASKE